MPNLDRMRHYWDQTTNLMANTDSQQQFMNELDGNQDGKVTAAELKTKMDTSRDGEIDAQELEAFALKASASDIDRTTIKSLGAAATRALPTLSLFEHSATDTEHKIWKMSADFDKNRDQLTTVLPHSKVVLASRDLKAVSVARKGTMFIQEQRGNSCGTTSLSMLMKYFQGHNLENSVTTIDSHIRANGRLELGLPNGEVKGVDIDGFTAARDMVDYANSRGMRVGMKNNSSTSEIKDMLNRGVPCLCLTDWNFETSWPDPKGAKPDGKSLHWVNVIGYEYAENPTTKAQELHFLVANPHGAVQRISEKDFDTVWRGGNDGLQLEIPKTGVVNTGMKRLFVAMVPKDDEARIVAPDGSARPARDIPIPTGNDGFRGKLAQMGSDLIQKAANFQDDMGKKGGQLIIEAQNGYSQDGIRGLIRNVLSGDASQINELRQQAKGASIERRAEIINGLLEQGVNREAAQNLTFEILRDASWSEFPTLLDKIDAKKLSARLSNDSQAGQVMAWIARSEIERTGTTGNKFEIFAQHLSQAHRSDAINTFLNDKHMTEGGRFAKVSTGMLRDMIVKLMSGNTGSGEEKAIYNLLKATTPAQFDQVTSRLNMAQLAAELEDVNRLADITVRAIDLSSKNGRWGNVSEILTNLERIAEYTRADDVLGVALTQPQAKNQLGKIPAELRHRMVNLLDDVTRWRSDKAIAALNALKKL